MKKTNSPPRQAGRNGLMATCNVLTEPLLTVRDRAGQRTALTLPDVLSRLGNGDDVEPLALRAHQQHAWHAFLVQLAALALDRVGDHQLASPPEAWRAALYALAGPAGDAAWSLVVPDLSQPAFLQPPVPEGSLERFKNTIAEPDGLDVVMTAKNHDVKAARITHPRPEHWIYSLVTLQTMQGFLGQGNYGIARMNGGFSSRPAVAAAPGLGWAERFRRDVAVWLETRDELLELYGYKAKGGHALLWLLPWDGASSRPLRDCDPFFIEVCRRVRCEESGGRVVARTTPTKAAFLQAKEQRGDTGDIWAPVRLGSGALSVTGAGFTYRLLADILLSGDYRWKPALRFRQEDGEEPIVLAQVLARGEGETNGYHQRLLPIPAEARRRLLAAQPETLGTIAKDRVERVRLVQSSILKPALCALLQGGRDDLDFRDRRVQPWLERFDAEVDRVFFEDLWAGLPLTAEAREQAWDDRLRTLAWGQLAHAMESAPVPLAHRPKARARAELMFRGTARKQLHLPAPDPQPTDSPAEVE